MNQNEIIQKIKIELAKCKSDPVYFMKNYCYIQHPQRGKIKFKLYPFQEETLEQFNKHRFNIILKSRQLGISTLSAGDALWNCLFTKDFSGLAIATKTKVAAALVKKVKVMYEMLPEWFKTKSLGTNLVTNNILSIELGNGSKMVAESCTEDSGRSGSYSRLYLDESSFISERLITELWSAAYPTLSTGGSAVILSTPNGIGNWFHRMWIGALSGDNGFNPINLKWTVHPERDQKWRDEQTKVLGVEKAEQECDGVFTSSGTNFINLKILTEKIEPFLMTPLEKRGMMQDYWLFDYPDYSKQYLICADVARGDGSDYSGFHVLDALTLDQVAEYKNQIGTTDFANLLIAVATEWNNALLVVENNNNGWAVVTKIEELGYENLYYFVKDVRAYDTEVYIKRNLHVKDKVDMIPGFSTNGKTRPLLLSNLQNHFLDDTLVGKIKSRRLYNELTVFIWKGGKAQAMSGYNDDLVMSYGIGLWIRDTHMKLETAGVDVSKYLLNNIGTGVSSMPASSLHFFGDSRYTWTDMRGNTYDLRKLGK